MADTLLQVERFSKAAEIPFMKDKKMHWGVVALVTSIVLFLGAYVLPPLPKAKARASRISTVNHVARVAVTIPSTNALPAVPTNK